MPCQGSNDDNFQRAERKFCSFVSFGSIVVTEKSNKDDPNVLAKTEAKTDTATRNLCCYSQRVCNLEKLKGFDFCHKHILEDKASPFKPCDFVAKSNGRRCPNPAPKLPDRGKRSVNSDYYSCRPVSNVLLQPC